MSEDRKIFSLSQLTTALENFIAKNFAVNVFWVTAEITKLSCKGGHSYLELAETSRGQLLSQIQGNFWYSNYKLAKEKYGETLDEILQSGNSALFLVRIEYHKIFGLKLNILDVDPSYSYGEMERQKQMNIAKLKENGLYFLQKNIKLPRVCKRIALIGSPNTSGFQDFVTTLQNNEYFTNFRIKVFPSSVQGNEAKLELLKQIHNAQEYLVDVIVLVRGGGSKTDLNIFNDYEICEAICLSKIPFVTGIGHETDDVISAHISRLDCITPTAAAKHFYIQISSFLSELRNSFDTVIQEGLILLQAHQLEFNELEKRLGFWSSELFKKQKNTLAELSQHLFRIVHFNLISKYQDLEIILLHVEANTKKKISQSRDIELKGHIEDLHISSKFYLEQERNKLSHLEDLIEMLNPLKLLKKGYTISTINDFDVNQIQEIQSGDVLKTLSNKHLIVSTINTIELLNYE